MMMKPFLPLSNKRGAEMEGSYPFFSNIRNGLLKALVMPDLEEKKQSMFHALRSAESSVSAQMGKLRNKPKRATKFCACLKRVIMILKIALESLPDKDQLEAYPTLSLICTHFVNIILLSSVSDHSPPKFVASNMSCFLKTLFSHDLEFVLDALVCSNIFEDAESKKGVGYYMLVEAMLDGYLYTHDTSAFAKYLTILAFLNECTSGQDEVIVTNTLANLDSYSVTLTRPEDMLTHLKSKFKMNITKKLGNRVSWKSLIQFIKSRKVANITRRERLIVVSGKRNNNKKQSVANDIAELHLLSPEPSDDGIYSNTSLHQNPRTKSTPFFFMDRGGKQRDNDNHVSCSADIHYDDGGGSLLSLTEDTQSSMDGLSLLPMWNEDNEDSSDGEFVPQNSHGSSINTRVKNNSFENGLPILSPKKSFTDDDTTLSPSRSSKVPSYHHDSDGSESDLEVVFEHTNNSSLTISKTEDCQDDDSNDSTDTESGESRDFAPSESGEDEFPNYSPTDFVCHKEDEEDQQNEDISDTTLLPEDDSREELERETVTTDSANKDIPEMHNHYNNSSTTTAENFVEDNLENEVNSSHQRKSKQSKEYEIIKNAGSPNRQGRCINRDERSPPKIKRRRILSSNDGEDENGGSISSSSIQCSSTASEVELEKEKSLQVTSPKKRSNKKTTTAPSIIANIDNVPEELSCTSPRRMRTRSGSAERNEVVTSSCSAVKGRILSPLKEAASPTSSPPSTTAGSSRNITRKGSNMKSASAITRKTRQVAAVPTKVVSPKKTVSVTVNNPITPSPTKMSRKKTAASTPSSTVNIGTEIKRRCRAKKVNEIPTVPIRTTRSTTSRTRGVKKI